MAYGAMAASGPVERKAGYMPDGRAFVCVNGSNRYTRALYGSTDEYRIETSDRPVFATYEKVGSRNIRFRLEHDGTVVQLDSAEWCEARYEAGRRDYTVRDRRWNGGELHLAVTAFNDTKGGSFRFSAKGFKKAVKIEGLICETRVQKFSRFGDIGNFTPKDCFDASPDSKQLATATVTAGTDDVFFTLDGTVLHTDSQTVAAQRFAEAELWRTRMAGSVVFDTPDPYFNTIGGTLVMAADGAWDGKVWTHGAVGWHMPLTGWRAAYAGDFLGMPDRQRTHFTAYAKSQVTGVPVTLPHLMDRGHNLSRGAYKWGTPMYSDGYICRNPEKPRQFHHYDMNLVYIDELLWHFQFDADTAYMRRMWPVIKSHLEWEKRTWDPDNDGLYDAYCCIWASDALQYNSGAVTHSSAYNYRGNVLAARIAELIGENPEPYRREARRILEAMNARLWVEDAGHWAEYQDFMGLRRLHKSAALWSIYTPIDCGACSPEQAYRATRYVDSHIPHIPYSYAGTTYNMLSTTRWSPYEWSLNNVAMAEMMHTALAYYKVGRSEEAFRLLKANVLDFMYLGTSPGNLGQLSMLDRAMGESYRDFSDVTGMASRALVEGLYGITPEALYSRCVIRQGFPAEWDSASVRTPYIEYTFRRVGNKEVYDIKQRFARPLKIVIRQNAGRGKYVDTEFTADSVQHIELVAVPHTEEAPAPAVALESSRGNGFDDIAAKRCRMVDMSGMYNANVTDIFKQKYLTPRSPYTTLCVPTQGIGDWCSTKRTAKIDDSGLRSLSAGNRFTALGIPFGSPATGHNIVYTSLWDNYPDSVTLPLEGKASHAYLLMAGSTNPMQAWMANAVVYADYADGTRDSLLLVNPENWCPIEQDYLTGETAFPMPQPRPYRVGLKTGKVSRNLFEDTAMAKEAVVSDVPEFKKAVCEIDGGAAVLLDMPLDPKKRLRSLTLRVLSNEVVVGLMGVTLQK